MVRLAIPAWAKWLALMLLAAAVRLSNVTACLPYLNYVDEGQVLHHVVHLLAGGEHNPDVYSYGYPPLVLRAIALASRSWSIVRVAAGLQPIEAGLSPYPFEHYDIVAPVDLLITGRLATLIASLGTVVVTGLVARSLAGGSAAAAATLAAAVLPGLVIRSSTVTVDMWATFFSTAALYVAWCGTRHRLQLPLAAAAGALTGLAAVSKYPAGLVGLPVVLLQLAERSRARRVGGTLAVITAAGLAIVVVMPALLWHWGGVLSNLRGQTTIYANRELGALWSQALVRAEWDLPLEGPEMGVPFVILACAGAFAGLSRRETRKFFIVSTIYSLVLAVLLASYRFRPFRNLLPILPLACVSLGLFYDAIRRRLREPALADAVAALALLCVFLPSLFSYVRERRRCVDSRVEAVDWMLANAPPGDTVAVHPGLAVLPGEVARLEGHLHVLQWGKGAPDFLVLPEGTSAPPDRQRAAFGQVRTPDDPGFWRGNRQRIRIVEPPRGLADGR